MDLKGITPVVTAIFTVLVVVGMTLILYGYSVGFVGTASKTLVEGSSFLSKTATGEIVSVDESGNNIYVRNTNTDITPVIQAVYKDNAKTSCSNVRLSASGSVELNASNCSGLIVEDGKTYKIAGTDGLEIIGTS